MLPQQHQKSGRGMDNRRSTIVINKKFQYQYSLLIAAMAVLMINGFIIVRLLFPGEQPLTLTTSMTLGLAAVELMLLGLIWYGSLVASHRIAGPVYVFAREISKLGDGDLTANIRLRDKDMFQPEAEKMNASIKALNTRLNAIKRLCDQLQQAQGSDKDQIVQQLAAEVSVFALEGE
jgi:methyl-accepting chemotaxis protein